MEAQAHNKPDQVRAMPARGNRGQEPYSPTDPMDWEDTGLPRLFGDGSGSGQSGTPPPPSLEDRGVLVDKSVSEGGGGGGRRCRWRGGRWRRC
jgi:hypothetical protein